jgi:hypothetical protein
MQRGIAVREKRLLVGLTDQLYILLVRGTTCPRSTEARTLVALKQIRVRHQRSIF